MHFILFTFLCCFISFVVISQNSVDHSFDIKRNISGHNKLTAPVADFAASIINVNVGDTIDYYDQSLNSPTIWNWTFSGGSPSWSSIQNPTNVQYNYPGNFDVQLFVENTDGSDSKTRSNYIIVSTGGTSPAAHYLPTTYDPIIFQKVEITDISYNNPANWQWTITPNTFGFINGTNSSTQNVDIEFYSPGTYEVTMNVSNSYGSSTVTHEFYVTQYPCDTLAWIHVPTYDIYTSDSSVFSIQTMEFDNLIPTHFLFEVKVNSIPSGWYELFEGDPDLYFKLYDGSNSLIYTSSTQDNTPTPVWWYPTIKTKNEIYTIHMWDDDSGSNPTPDDDLGTINFNGTYGSGYYTYANGDLSLTLWQYNHGYTTNWDVRDDIWSMDSNSCYTSTSYFYPAGQADNWLMFGPVTLPNEGGEIIWNHSFRSNSWRDGYKLHVNVNGLSVTDFQQTGVELFSISDNDSTTLGDVDWTRQSVALNGGIYGGQSLYFAFEHNADDMFALHLDEMIIRGCNTPPVSIMDKDDIEIKIYPNPFDHSIIIENLNSYLEEIFIYDMQGRNVFYKKYEEICDDLRLDLENISKGLYTLDIRTSSSSIKKLIVKSE